MTENPPSVGGSGSAGRAPIAVIKVGGDVALTSQGRKGLAQNIRGLHEEGWRIVLLHGGGPQVNSLQERLGLPIRKVGGRRITSREDLQVVKQAICGETNVDLVCALLHEKLPAFGLHGASASLIQAEKRPPRVFSGAGSESVDFGEVGDVKAIQVSVLHDLLDLAYLPVIATLGVNDEGRVFNINADTTCVQIARALQADMLLLTTAVGGIFRDVDDPASRFVSLDAETARELIKTGVIQGGMIPKVEEALSVLDYGVKKIAVVGPDEVGSFRDIALEQGSYGTRIHLHETHVIHTS